MTPDPTPEFMQALSRHVAPELYQRRFAFDGERTFRREVEHEQTRSTQIIEFQLGGESLKGRFTVTLAVFNADYTPTDFGRSDGQPHSFDCLGDLVHRLGFLRTPERSRWDRVLGRHPEPNDCWWKLSEIEHVMKAQLGDVMNVLMTRGLNWLDSRTTVAGFNWAVRQLERRKAWKAALGKPGATAFFTPEPFPGEND